MSLRWRLTLFYGLVTAVLLLSGGIASFLSFRASLSHLLDESLDQAATIAVRRHDADADRVESERLEPRAVAQQATRPRLPDDTYLSVFTAGGQPKPGFDASPVKAPLRPGLESVDAYRVLTVRTPDGDWLQVARSEADALSAVDRTRATLALGAPLLLALGLAAGYVLADRALKPVDAVSHLAARIARSGRPGERVPQAPGNDEMAHLTRTVNAMLATLEELLDHERAFALAAAHELRTPLAVLRARASLSLERARSPEHYREALRTVAATTDDLHRLVEGLLALARSGQPLEAVPVDLADVALEAVEAHDAAMRERGQRVTLELAAAPAAGDPAALRLAASNLVRNAVRYARDGARIRVRTGTAGGRVTLEVNDDGPGVPDADLERLRRPFQRGHGLQAVSGSGLGLAIVDAVASRHGGRLELGRAAEGGFRASVVVPAAGLVSAT